MAYPTGMVHVVEYYSLQSTPSDTHIQGKLRTVGTYFGSQ